MNTVVKEFESQGYVVLSPIKGEKREMLVSLTESGKQYAEEKLAEIYEIEDKAFSNLSDDHKKVIEYMNKLLDELNKQS